MRKLSSWARQNKWEARIIIVLSHIVLILLAWFTGSRLTSIGFDLPAYLVYVFAVIYFMAVFAYPSLKNKTRLNIKSVYIKQKICDFTLAASAFCMVMILAGNKNSSLTILPSSLANNVSVSTKEKESQPASEILASLKYRDKSTLTRSEKKILKQEFKKQLKNYAVAKLSGNKKEAGDAGLIILTVIAAVGLLYLVAALSCSLSCNGSDGAAVVVALLGTAAIILGVIFVVRKITNRTPKVKTETQSTGS